MQSNLVNQGETSSVNRIITILKLSPENRAPEDIDLIKLQVEVSRVVN